MKHWLLMFKPETYEVVKDRGVIGVLHIHRRRFAELSDGDRFVAFISRRQQLDAHGVVVGQPFEDIERVWPGRELYPQRCRVAFEQVGAEAPAKELLWDLDVWKAREKPLSTSPWNMLFCYGGFLEVPESDYRTMVDAMAG